MEKIKISDLPEGMIIWKGYNILGITKATLPEKYYDCYCKKVLGTNELDYEFIGGKIICLEEKKKQLKF